MIATNIRGVHFVAVNTDRQVIRHSEPFYEKKETWWRINNRKVSSLGAWLSKYLIAIPKYYLGYYDRKIAKRYRYIYKNTDAFATLFDDYSRSVASAIGVGDIENSKLYTLQNPMPRIDYTCENVERGHDINRKLFQDCFLSRVEQGFSLQIFDFFTSLFCHVPSILSSLMP